MSKRSRLFICFLVFGVCGYFSYPSIAWYFIFSQQERDLLNRTPKELLSMKEVMDKKILRLKEILPYSKQKIKNTKGNYILNLRPLPRLEAFVIDISDQNELLQLVLPNSEKTIQKEFLTLSQDILKTQKFFVQFEKWKNLRRQIVKPGLDLAGGSHLSIGVDKWHLVEKIREQYYETGLQDNLPVENVVNSGTTQIEKITWNTEKLKKYLKTTSPLKSPMQDNDNAPELQGKLQAKQKQLSKEYSERIQVELKEAIDNAITVIRNRVDKFGISEIQIHKTLEDTIFVELPGLDKDDLEYTTQTILESGELTFRILDEEKMSELPISLLIRKGKYRSFLDPKFVTQSNKGFQIEYPNPSELPKLSLSHSGSSLYPIENTDKFGNVSLSAFVILKNKVEVDGKFLKKVSLGYNPQTNLPEIYFQMNNKGAMQFQNVSATNINSILGILLDNKVKSLPRISQTISSSGKITLGDDGNVMREARKLLAVLKAGVLPTSLRLINQITVGAHLGEENIRYGLMALNLGMLCVMLFTLVYYKWCGLIAIFCLLCNLGMLFSILSYFGFTLTLPGIAGIILTIGMAIDANVIIFERIKEELHEKHSITTSIRNGYEKGFSAILDANLTTIIVAFILSNMGSGIVRGFGFTLMLGILSSFFSSLFVSRLILEFFSDSFRLKKLSI